MYDIKDMSKNIFAPERSNTENLGLAASPSGLFVMEELLELSQIPRVVGKQGIPDKSLVFAGESDGEEGRKHAGDPQGTSHPVHIAGEATSLGNNSRT